MRSGRPAAPGPAEAARALAVLAELVADGGAARLLAPPVAPGPAAFPEPWRATAGGVATLLRRLAAHAEVAWVPTVEDDRRGAPPTERRPPTQLELREVDAQAARFVLSFIGRDDVAGTLAHEIGVAHALRLGADRAGPYRAASPPARRVEGEGDLARGSIATVYLGLGVLAANAAYQEYSGSGRSNGAYVPLEYDVLRAGHVPMSLLAYLLAVQAVLRGQAAPPPGLSGPAHDEASAWIAALAAERDALCAAVGVDPRATAPAARAALVPIEVVADEAPPARLGLRWRTHRGGLGLLLGLVAGGAVGVAAARLAAPLIVAGGAVGHAVGRRARVVRCSRCAEAVGEGAPACGGCGAVLRGDIARLDDRLEVEEALDGPGPEDGGPLVAEAPEDHGAPAGALVAEPACGAADALGGAPGGSASAVEGASGGAVEGASGGAEHGVGAGAEASTPATAGPGAS